MTEILQDPLGIAEVVAQLIMEYSHSSQGDIQIKGLDDKRVYDILLFGSTLRGDAHDVDMLLIHNLPELYDFGIVSKYDPNSRLCFPDPDAKREDVRWTSEDILDALGSPEVEDLLDEKWSISDAVHKCFTTRRVFVRTGSRFDGISVGYNDEVAPYSGNFTFDVIGEVYVNIDDHEGTMQRVNTLVKERITERQAVTKIKKALAQRGLPVNDTLDLHVMARYLLRPDKGAEDRAMVIKQCRDPTFWYTVLTSGRLYNKDTGKFDQTIDQKYPDACKLFQQ